MNTHEAFHRVLELLSQTKNTHLLDYQDPENLKQTLNLDKESDGNWDQLFDWLEKYLTHTPNTQHPLFLNRMWSAANLPSVLAEIVTAATNTSSCSYESAPVATLIEQYMIRQIIDLIGFQKAEGQMTTGSSNANMIGLMIARNQAVQNAKQKGLWNSPPFYCFVNEDAHYSIDKAANVLGIGAQQLIKIPTNTKGQMDVLQLEKAIDTICVSKQYPFCVVATAGTTVRGAYDPIDAIYALKKKYQFWLHVDAAWGGAALVSKQLRQQFLTGVEQCDSFTWDFHKMLGTAMMCNVLLINLTHSKNESLLAKHLATGDMSYIYREEELQQNPGIYSLQCARKVDALKWFLDWKFYGTKNFEKRVENYHALLHYAAQAVTASTHFKIVVPAVSFNLCFCCITPPHIDAQAFHMTIREKLYKQNKLLISFANIKGQFVFRFLMTNPDMTRTNIDQMLGHIAQMADTQLAQMR